MKNIILDCLFLFYYGKIVYPEQLNFSPIWRNGLFTYILLNNDLNKELFRADQNKPN